MTMEIGMKQLITILLTAFLLPVAASHAGQRNFVVGVEDQHYLPVYSVANGVYSGYAREVLDAFAKERGYTFEYRPLPIPRLYATFLKDQLDFKFPDNPSWKKEQRSGMHIAYSDPVVAYIDGVSVMPDKKLAGPDEIKVLGTMAGFTPWPWLDRINAGKTHLVENSNLESLVWQTLKGRIDGAYANVSVINYQLDQVIKQPGALTFNAKLPYSRDYYLLSSIKHPDILAEFNAWMKQNHARIAALKKKHAVEKGVIAN
jgi:ABC-type amino acid transport substrate-binding protein